MSLQTIEIEAFSGPTSVLIGGGNQPTIVYINQGPAGTSGIVDQTIIDGSTNAVAGNAVFDALALKAPLASPTFTGTVNGITKSMVGLSNVDNTSDANKPVSTAQQTALNLKANLASPTFTGIVTAPRITGRCDGLEVLCKAGLAIAAGQVVYVTGASGNNIIIGLARANAEATSSKTIGISESTLANNATGYVITEGLMTVSISAPTANEGDPIWLSPATAGSMVFGAANKPFAPNHIVYLGVVTRKTGNTVVEIYVKVQNGAELDELSDVLITSPVAGQALMRGATLWENRSLVSADISNATSAATANTLALRDGSGGSNFAAVGATTVTASGVISTTGADATISTNGYYATIYTTGYNAYIYTTGSDAYISTTGVNATISTTGDFAHIYTTGSDAYISTTGDYGNIYTNGSDAYISTFGADAYISTSGTNAYIQSRSTFKLFNGTYTTTLSHSPTADRAIAFPNTSGTVALINPSSGAQTFSGAQSFSGQVELTGQAATNPTSAMTRALVDARVMPQAHLPSRYAVSESDFITTLINTAPYGLGFAGISAPGGAGNTVVVGSSEINSNHPGVLAFSSGTLANSGSGTSTSNLLPIRLGGGEEYTLIFKPVLNATTFKFRIGFSAGFSTLAPTYFAFAEAVGDGAGNVVFSAITANFSGGTTTTTTNATTYSAPVNAWYQMRVAVNESAASVSFYLYSESGTLLWSVTNSTNIPTLNVQAGCIFYNATVGSATTIAYVDYHKFEINRTLIR